MQVIDKKQDEDVKLQSELMMYAQVSDQPQQMSENEIDSVLKEMEELSEDEESDRLVWWKFNYFLFLNLNPTPICPP